MNDPFASVDFAALMRESDAKVAAILAHRGELDDKLAAAIHQIQQQPRRA